MAAGYIPISKGSGSASRNTIPISSGVRIKSSSESAACWRRESSTRHDLYLLNLVSNLQRGIYGRWLDTRRQSGTLSPPCLEVHRLLVDRNGLGCGSLRHTRYRRKAPRSEERRVGKECR